MSAVSQFLKRIQTVGRRRTESVRVTAMGRKRVFEAYDVGKDTFVFERGIARHLNERPSVLLVEKGALRNRARGRVMTVSTGNHSVAAFPLLDGRFWKFSNLPPSKRSETLMREILCANVVTGRIEISQREVSTEGLVAGDNWLRQSVGFQMTDIVMVERNATTLEHFRQRGQEWRVKPLAWTESEMRAALAASRKRMSSQLTYYHSARGVHFLTFAEFSRFCQLAESDPAKFIEGLRELVSVYEGNACAFTRMPKHRGHHEIEFFGTSRGTAENRLIPELERLMEAVELNRIGQLGVIQRSQEIVRLYRSQLSNPAMADEKSRTFVETLYMYITGEIYSIVGEGSTPAFDDRRTALPGATFADGVPTAHPGADERTKILLDNLRNFMSKDEFIEYANVYELRAADEDAPLGWGATREVVYKKSSSPLESSLVEKRLSRQTPGYGAYLFARIGALRSLGVSISDLYVLLKPPRGARNRCDHYIRRRCEGEPMEAIPANYFSRSDNAAEDDGSIVLALAVLMGDAAAQNMAMKKFDAQRQTPLFGIGKEIYEFDYDVVRGRMVPKNVSTCSVRGSFGWPSLEQTDENMRAVADFYMGHFASAVRRFHRRHPNVALSDLVRRFWDGFEHRTHAMAWKLSVLRDRFEAFHPDVHARFGFDGKWRFAMWSLLRQERNLDEMRTLLRAKVAASEDAQDAVTERG